MGAERTDINDQQSPEQLQRQLEQTRESISHTVTEIQNTMTTEFQNVKSNISETLDWRLQVRQHPLAFSLGALALGLLVGRGLASRSHDSFDDTDDEFFGNEMAQTHSSRHHRVSKVANTLRQSNAFHQVSDGLSTVLGELVNELVKVGREQVIPSVVGKVTTSLGLEDSSHFATPANRF